MKNLKTINLQGKEYVQVNTRLEYFNQEYPNSNINNSYESVGGNQFIFKSVITPDIDKPLRFFVGHSHGEVSRDKALEKLETVAVGRALAFMGIGIVESIASAEEIEKFTAPTGGATIHSDAPFHNVPGDVPMPDKRCIECGAILKLIPAGVSKSTGKPYKAFYACPDKHRQF